MAGQKEGKGEITCFFFTDKYGENDSDKMYVILEEKRGNTNNEEKVIAIGKMLKDKLY